MSQKSSDKQKAQKKLPKISRLTSEDQIYISGSRPEIEGYEIIEVLGEAGQGQVWRAKQLSTNREVALKMPHAGPTQSRKTLQRFQREVELASRLKHPNVARIYDSGIYQGYYYYAMELIEGHSLDEYVQRNNLDKRAIVKLMCSVCEGVQHAHQNGVIHRDIKPSNILVTEDMQPHVVDFGLARNIRDDLDNSNVSVADGVIGTPAYMSPEQAAGRSEDLDTRSDIYSVGVVLYQLLTRQFPYDVEGSIPTTLGNICSVDPVKPSNIASGLDSDLEVVLLKTLSKEPDQRYQSAAELRLEMERWLQGLPITAKSDSSLYLLRKIISKHRYSSTVAALLFVIVLGFLCFSVQLYSKYRDTDTELRGAARSLATENEEYMRLAGQMAIIRFLDAWHEGDTGKAEIIAAYYGRGTREATAASFLLDSKPVEEKVSSFREDAGSADACFAEFIIAEHLYEDRDFSGAAQSYRECISDSEGLEKDPWVGQWAKSRLFDLGARRENTEVPSTDDNEGIR